MLFEQKIMCQFVFDRSIIIAIALGGGGGGEAISLAQVS